jgi:hypothetical protein
MALLLKVGLLILEEAVAVEMIQLQQMLVVQAAQVSSSSSADNKVRHE